jgi:hypothetical protein
VQLPLSTLNSGRLCLAGDFLKLGVPPAERAYEELSSDPSCLAKALDAHQVQGCVASAAHCCM